MNKAGIIIISEYLNIKRIEDRFVNNVKSHKAINQTRSQQFRQQQRL